MRVAEHRIEAPAQTFVRQDGVQIEGRLRNAHIMALGRDRAMQIGQRFGVIEGMDFRHELAEQIERAIGFGEEPVQFAVPVAASFFVVAFDQGTLGAGDMIDRRHIYKCHIIGVLIMFAAPRARLARRIE